MIRMTDTSAVQRPPAPDFATLTPEELITWRDAENLFRQSPSARTMLGEPDPRSTIEWRRIPLPGRELPVRVYRPATGHSGLPLVLHVHGGGYVGTAPQCDWANSHLAVRLPAVLVSVEHRLVAPDTPLSAAADDGWETLQYVLRTAEQWGVDATRIAVFGESCGALISALTAVRAARSGLKLRAQVLVNPATDVTGTMFEYPSMAEFADTPTASLPSLELFHRLAVPAGSDPREVSPLYAEDLSDLAPALIVVPTADPVADHGRRYADRLWMAGTTTRLSEYPDAPHAFLTLPGLVAQAEDARAEITEFLSDALAA